MASYDWSRAADIIIVGGGGAGLAAAVEATEYTSHVIVLEKEAALGGTTALAIGSISCGGTSVQRKAGIQDTPEAFREDLRKIAGDLEKRCDQGLCKMLAEKSPETIDWLIKLGIQFYGPNPEPPHRVPRMHNMVPNPRVAVKILNKKARAGGAEILLGTECLKLLQDNDGRVIGVEAEDLKTGEHLLLKAKKGVIFASGDYSANAQMKGKYIRPEMADVDPINPSCTGDGQRMGMEIGAAVKNMDIAIFGPELRFPIALPSIGYLPTSPVIIKLIIRLIEILPRRLITSYLVKILTCHASPSIRLLKEGAVLINKKGNRFTNELDKLGTALDLPKQPDKIAYMIFDQNVAKKFCKWPYYVSTSPGIAYAYLSDYRKFRKDVFYEAKNVEELSRMIGINFEALNETIQRYNLGIDEDVDREHNRSKLGEGVKTPPFYALGPIKSVVATTEGGLAINLKCQVIDTTGKVIPGLYAIGSVAGGIILVGHGTHLGWCFTSGRIAAKAIAGVIY